MQASVAAAAVGALSRCSSASTSSGESRANRRICRIRGHPLAAHDHGNSFSGSEGQPHSAICESTLAPGSTVAQHHLRLLLPRDNPPFRPRSGCFGDPTKEKEQLRNYRIGQEKTPLAPKASGETRLWASRCGARAQRRLASAQPPPRT